MTEGRELRVFTPQEAAAVLKLNPQTVWKYIRAGKLRASRIGRVYRIREADIERLLDDTRADGGADHSPANGKD